MKTCKDIFPFIICDSCSRNNISNECYISGYRKEISYSSFNILFKRYNFFISIKDTDNYIIFNKVLELYYPELKNRLEKLMVLI